MKDKYPNDILLIPIAANLNLELTKLMLNSYNYGRAPVVIIDEKTIISEIVTFDELEKSIFQSNKA